MSGWGAPLERSSMNNLRAWLRDTAGKLLRTGFFSVFFSNVLCKVLTFIGGMVIVRLLSKSDYGEYTYVMNCYGMLVLLNDLGCCGAAVQFCSENHADAKRFHGFFIYGLTRGMAFSGLTALLLLVSPWFYPFKEAEAARLAQSLCLMPFLSTASAFLLENLRLHLKYTLYGAVNLFQTVTHYLVILPMTHWIGVRGAVFSNYVITLLVLLFTLALSRGKLDLSRESGALTVQDRRDFLRLAFASQLNNGVAQALVMLDVFFIGIFILDNEVISSYKIASTIPSALAFIPRAVVTYVGPHFARNNRDLPWVRSHYAKLTLASAGVSLLITLGGIAVSPWMIPLVFGRQYEDAVPCFIVLMIGYFFYATFQCPTQNIIYTQRKVRINIIVTFLSGAANCVLDPLLIFYFGSIGAACATTAVHIIASILCFGYMCFYLRRTPA